MFPIDVIPMWATFSFHELNGAIEKNFRFFPSHSFLSQPVSIKLARWNPDVQKPARKARIF